jgi:hypothetical protein
MSKITFGEKFSSSLLLSTFLGAAVVTTGFMCSASAMERTRSGYSSSEDERDRVVPHAAASLEERNSAAARLQRKEEGRALNQLVDSVRTGNASTLWMTEADRADFERLFSPTGEIGYLPKDMRGRLLEPAKAKAIIEDFLRNGQAAYYQRQDYERFLESVRAGNASTLWMTEADKADFERLFSPTGKIACLPKDAQGRLLEPAKAKAIIEDFLRAGQTAYYQRQDYERFLESVRAGNASTLWMTEADKADFERLFSPTGKIACLQKDVRGRLLEPAKAKAIIEDFLRNGQENYQAEQEMDRFLANVRTHPSYLSLTAQDWTDFNQAMATGTGSLSLSYAENQRPAVRMTKIKAWLEARQADRQAEQGMSQFLEHAIAHPQYTSLTAEDWADFNQAMATGTGSLSLSYTENRRPAVRMAKIKAWLEARQADRVAKEQLAILLSPDSRRTLASYTWMTPQNWAAFDQAVRSGMGLFSFGGATENLSTKKLNAALTWLEERRPAR